MKHTLIGIVVVALILILYYQFGKKNESVAIHQNKTPIETRNAIKSSDDVVKKIHRKAYDRYILTKNTSKSYILNGIREYGSLSGNETYKMYNFEIATYGDWHIIQVEESISFYEYHNLVGWLYGYGENQDIPELSIGFSKSKTDAQEDYLFFLDPENKYGDSEIGAFRNGKTFFVYLPEAYEEYGNLTIKDTINVSLKENEDAIAAKGLIISNITTLEYTQHKIKMND